MKRILLFGAGKSATCLIDYLGKELNQNDWWLIVCDADLGLAQRKIQGIEHAEAMWMDVADALAREQLIRNADLVISMLPPALHFVIAQDCVAFGKNLLTASYVDENIRSLEPQIVAKKLLFICEMGLDPGIDHMSAIKMIHAIGEKGGSINSFISHCGGLISRVRRSSCWPLATFRCFAAFLPVCQAGFYRLTASVPSACEPHLPKRLLCVSCAAASRPLFTTTAWLTPSMWPGPP